LTSSSTRDDCPRCHGTGLELTDEATARVCSCQRIRAMQETQENSRITPAFQAKTFENFRQDGRPPIIRKLYTAAKDYADQFNEIQNTDQNGLLFCGQPGSGKTHLCIALANQLLGQGTPVRYFRHKDGMGELKDLVAQRGRVQPKIQELKDAPVLVWDDLFKRQHGADQDADQFRGWDIDVAIDVIYYRYEELLPTIISTELTPKQLCGIDEGMGSRIVERSKGRIVVVNGLDANYRLRGDKA
jgi:DNA replication protein DnaC